MLKCDSCGQEWVYKLTVIGEKGMCENCYSAPASQDHSQLVETFHLEEYGNVSKARWKELWSRTILPYEKGQGEYYLGRKNRYGKIEEKSPTY